MAPVQSIVVWLGVVILGIITIASAIAFSWQRKRYWDLYREHHDMAHHKDLTITALEEKVKMAKHASRMSDLDAEILRRRLATVRGSRLSENKLDKAIELMQRKS